MAMGSGLLALALMVADGPSCSPEEATTFQVRVLTLDGLDWRTASYSRLQPVARQGTSAIWTADRTLATILADRASSVSGGQRMMTTTEAVLSQSETINYVAAMDRVADGPINQSSAIAFMPRPERVDERFAIKLSGRKLDQGVLTRVTLEETHVDAMHSVKQTEWLKPDPVKASRTTEEIGRDVVKTILSGESGEAPRSLTTQVQIPEVSQARIEGEWLIPKEGVLLISLGVKTAAGPDGKAVVRERVAVIEASMAEMPDAPVRPASYSKLSMPRTPLRSMPQSVDANGAFVDLPPLPEAVASTDLDRIKPEPNQPSPQARMTAATIAEPEADPALARTSFDAVPPAPNPPLVNEIDPETNYKARLARLKTLQEALEKAGFDLDIDVYTPDFKELRLDSTTCEKCDGVSPFCPSNRSTPPPSMAGGMKLVAERAAFGLSVKDAKGVTVGGSDLKLEEALKNPGSTETTVIPLGGHVSLEIKATLVPASAAKATARTSERSNPR